MCSSTCLRIESSVFPRIEIRDRCSTRVAAMQSIISADENGVCRVVMGQTLGRWKALRRGKMAQIVASTNERPQSAKKYEQRYLFPPCIRGTWARTARGPFAEIGTIELQPQPLSGGDQALRVHTFFVFSRASIINFANYREPRFCLLSCLVLKSKNSLGRACSIFFSKIGTNKIEEESYLF